MNTRSLDGTMAFVANAQPSAVATPGATTSTAPMWTRVKITDADGGLASVLELALVPPGIRNLITTGWGCSSLRDFATCCVDTPGHADHYVTALDELLAQDEEAAKVRANKGRLRSAWLAAKQALETLEGHGSTATNPNSASQLDNLEAPLPEDETREIEEAWSMPHGLPATISASRHT